MGSARGTAESRTSRGGRSGWGGLILGLYLGLFALTFWTPARFDQRSAASHALSLAEKAEARLGELLGTLRPVAARLRTGEALDWKEFERLFLADAGPDLPLVGWAPRVPHQERASFEAEAGRDAYRSLSVFEWSTRGTRTKPAGYRDHFPLYFGHPHPKADGLLGWDLASEPALAAAIKNAGRTHAPQLVLRAPKAADDGSSACTPLAARSGAGACEPHLVVVVPVAPSRGERPLKGVLVGTFPLAELARDLYDSGAAGPILSSVSIMKGGARRGPTRATAQDLGIGRASFTWGGAPWILELRLPPKPGLAARLLR